MLKTSIRNWALYRSLNVKFLKTERSQFLKPGSRNLLRPIVPNVQATGGVIAEPFLKKQPPTPSVAPEAAWDVHPEIAAVVAASDNREPPYRDVTVQTTLAVVFELVLRVPS